MYRKLSKVAILVIVILSALCFFPIKNLRFDFNIENFFPVDDTDLDFFNQYKERFNSQIEDEYIYIGLTNGKGVFDKDFLCKVDTLTRFVFEIDSIISVYSITNSQYHSIVNGRHISSPVVHFMEPEYFKEDSIQLFEKKDFKELLISKDCKSVSVSAFNSPHLNDKAKENMLRMIREKVEQLGFDDYHLTAKILVEQTYIKEIESNLKIYLVIAVLLISASLIILYRSVKGLIIPLVTLLFAVCWTFALISIFGYPVDIISSLLPPVLAVICMSDIIHIYSKYIDELRKGEEKIPALKNTFRDIGKATFYTSLTTAIGFFSLGFSNILPIRLFGIFAGTGVLLAYVIVIIFVFSININTPIPKVVHNKKFDRLWTRFLAALFINVNRHRFKILGTTILLLIVSVFFINKIQINSSLLLEIPKGNPILDDYNFIETQFAGTRPFEMALQIKDSTSSFLDIEVLKEIDEINTYLKDSCNVGMLISHLSFIKIAMQTFSGGNSEGYRVPDSEADVYYLCNMIMQSEWGGELIRFMSVDKKYCRLSGKLPDLTTIEFAALSKKFDNYFKSKKNTHFDYRMTGSGVLIDKTNYSLTENMFIGLFIAFCVISLIVGFMFRSFRMIIIVLIANIIPLVFMAAVMGMMGIYLKADTSVIFAISFGIVVDDSIHYLSRVRIELSKGKSLLYALKRSYLSTGKAMILTTMILLAGFGSLLFSSLGGAYYIGLLISLCLTFAVIIDLSILPLLILLFYKKR